MLTKQKKTKVIGEYKTHNKDTGSPEIQAALLTEAINELTLHLKKHAKDNHSRKGLLKMVAKRKKLIDYLAKEDEKRHKALLKALGIKK
ncbi:MAG: 30S ribosomal protein S15 [Candidatus Portnoybacteria bacterium CG10_big_fil_rev_8_21_14_0_10_36_7]|uniref:Small ribosomal subunit protein uS15 n=1 Tax=Candidatus Portnoybacteria bacterium CG10_big_fil_rev_8_21_14_0_10_36_7 TaxID=1974812 RepID=A0A2M8KF14_9BACT|nr:MAG: 30S ribosomal protein S15 [Candidatus Portnoybacteria bacterium CG10_big_fil_rev_8_21_14_0_10_36_7]